MRFRLSAEEIKNVNSEILSMNLDINSFSNSTTITCRGACEDCFGTCDGDCAGTCDRSCWGGCGGNAEGR